MSRAWLTLLMSLVPSFALAAGTGYSCDLRALTKEERSEHAELGRQMRSGVEQQRELANGYAFRLPADRWLAVARWAELERKCCPFFAFELSAAPDRGPVWLRITGAAGVKAFMKEEMGF